MTTQTAVEICKFLFVGGSVTVLHLAFVYFLTSILGMWYLLSSSLSYVCAVIINFFLQKYFVQMNKNTDTIKTQFVMFAGFALFCLGLNTIFMYMLVSIFDWQYLFAQAVVLLTLSVATFFVNRHFIF